MAEPVPGRARGDPGRAHNNGPAPWTSVLERGAFLRGRLFRELTSWSNLFRAWRDARCGKRRQPAVAAFEHRLEEHLSALRIELLRETYRPGPYTSFHIHEPKRRLISAAPFRDRVIHHALCNVIEPRFERSFVADSYANRIGRGTHRALDRCQELARTFSFVLQLDVRQFFPSVDHEILRARIGRKVTDSSVLRLIDLILASGKDVLRESYDLVNFPGDDLFAILRPRGLPIGNLTSQFWGNVYLDPIDHFVKRELHCAGYVRYVDDLLLFAADKRPLWEARDRLVERLAGLRLTIHRGAHPRPVAEGVPFLGFVVFPERRLLKRRKVVEFRRSLVGLLAGLAAGEIDRGRAAQSVRSWFEHARHGNTTALRRAILGKLPRAVRDLLN